MFDPLSLDPVVGGLGLLLVVGVTSSLVSQRRLKQWARAEGFTVLGKRLAAGSGSEFHARGFGAGWCYYVKVEDREKQVFQGWVKVGGLLAAMRGARCEVQWDNRPAYLRTA